jgi:hypothetical protein
MSLNFKRSRNDTAVARTYPNAQSIVIARTDVSNKNLLKNPYNNKSDPADDPGQRPWRKTTDKFGNVFAYSNIQAPQGITNAGLLQNPWRFREDAVDEPRTLTLQVIKDIGKGKLPRYVREDKGIDQIAFMILQYLSDNGVKLVTIALLKSFITGHRLYSLLDKGAQHVTRSFLFFNKLMDAARKYYKQGVLPDRMQDLIQDYVDGIYEVYGDAVMKPVSHLQIKEGLRELGSLSGVLSRLFRTQNAMEPERLVPYEQLVGLPPNPTPPIPQNLGDNEPSPPQSIKEPDNVADRNDPTTPANPSNQGDGIISPAVGSKNVDGLSLIPPESGRNIISKAMYGAAAVTAVAAGGYGLYKLRRQVGNFGIFNVAPAGGVVGGIIGGPLAPPPPFVGAVMPGGGDNIPLRGADVEPPIVGENAGVGVPVAVQRDQRLADNYEEPGGEEKEQEVKEEDPEQPGLYERQIPTPARTYPLQAVSPAKLGMSPQDLISPLLESFVEIGFKEFNDLLKRMGVRDAISWHDYNKLYSGKPAEVQLRGIRKNYLNDQNPYKNALSMYLKGLKGRVPGQAGPSAAEIAKHRDKYEILFPFPRYGLKAVNEYLAPKYNYTLDAKEYAKRFGNATNRNQRDAILIEIIKEITQPKSRKASSAASPAAASPAAWSDVPGAFGFGKKSNKKIKSKLQKSSKNIDSQILALLKG